MAVLIVLLAGVPLVVGGVLVVAGRPADRAAVAVGVGVAALVLGLSVAAALARPAFSAPLLPGIGAGLAVDALSALMVVTVAAATLAVLAFAAGEPALRTARFTGLILLFAGAMLVTVTATTLAVLLMAWEVMGATSWALIAFHWRDEAAVGAAHTAFLTTRFGDLGLYLAAGAALAGGVGSLVLAELPRASGPWLHVLAVGIALAALGKSAQLPFAFWLARAMRGPSPVSALLHSATMVAAGAYLLVRLVPLLVVTGWAGPLVAWVGAATALLLGAVAVAQRDLKQLLAASTCAQIGFMVMAAGAAAVGGGLSVLVAHAATKALLFLGAGAWLAALGTKQLIGLRGAARRFPLVGVTVTIGAASLAGLPPLALWATKDAALVAALERSPALYGVGLVAGALSAVYSAKAVWWIWRPVENEPVEIEEEPTGRVTAPMRRPLVALAVLAVALGALPLLLSGTIAVVPAPGAVELIVSAAVALLAAGVAWRRAERLPEPGVLRRWLGLETAAHAAVVRPVVALATALARFDDRVLARGVERAAGSVTALARLLDRRGEGAVDGAIARLTSAARALGRWARRPQTGQLHQYYAQSAVVLAALAFLLIVVR